MASTAVNVLSSAADYQKAFNMINRSYWAGSDNMFPVQLGDGRKLWVAGLSWSGNLTAAGARSATAPTVMNSVLIESRQGITPYQPAFYDASGRAHFLDSSKMWNIGRPTAARLEPLSGAAINNCLYMTVVSSASDFTSYRPTGAVSLIEIPQVTLDNGGCSISQSGTLPVINGVTFGIGLFTFDRKYLYLLGRMLSGSNYNMYWARVDTAWLSSLGSIANRLEFLTNNNGVIGWTPSPLNLMSVLAGVGPNAYTYSVGGGTYNYLYSVGMTIYGLAQRTIQRAAANIRSGSVSTLTTIPANAATGYAAQTIGMVPWAVLDSGNSLGYYFTTQSTVSYDVSNPTFSRPHFFEYPAPQLGRI